MESDYVVSETFFYSDPCLNWKTHSCHSHSIFSSHSFSLSIIPSLSPFLLTQKIIRWNEGFLFFSLQHFSLKFSSFWHSTTLPSFQLFFPFNSSFLSTFSFSSSHHEWRTHVFSFTLFYHKSASFFLSFSLSFSFYFFFFLFLSLFFLLSDSLFFVFFHSIGSLFSSFFNSLFTLSAHSFWQSSVLELFYLIFLPSSHFWKKFFFHPIF